MTWYFEGSCFVVKDMRVEFHNVLSPGFPFGWRGKSGGSRWHPGPRTIKGVLYHQTYGSLTPGEEGALRTARFLVANPWFRCPACDHVWEGTMAYPHTGCPKCGVIGKNLGRGRGFPKMSYHVFVPFRPLLAEGNRAIIYYCVEFAERLWHGGRANDNYVGVGFQGMFASRHIKRFRGHAGTDGQPSDHQKPIIGALWDEWLKPTLKLSNEQLKGHYDFGKDACPGDYIESEIRVIQGYPPLPGYSFAETPPDYAGSSDWFDTWQERQAALYEMGYDLGDYGPKKNGVDGDPGEATRAALEGFQTDVGITDTGFWDDATEDAMKDVLADNGLSYEDFARHLPDPS